MAWAYLLKSNRQRVAPTMMESFYRKAGCRASYYTVGGQEGTSFAIIENDPDPALVEVAIKNGLSYRNVWGSGGKTLLHLAVENNRARLVKYLAFRHSELLRVKKGSGQTALDIAREMDNKNLVIVLTQAQKRQQTGTKIL